MGKQDLINLSISWMSLPAYVTLIQPKEVLHQSVSDLQTVVYQNYDDSILDKELETSTGTYRTFHILSIRKTFHLVFWIL
jgi:hypothetical protein